MSTKSTTDVVGTIRAKLGRLSSEQQQVVLDFVEFLEQKQRPRASLFERIESIIHEVPEQAWKDVPSDGAEQHDHYLYGTPKRNT